MKLVKQLSAVLSALGIGVALGYAGARALDETAVRRVHQEEISVI
jgi:hypothetical protein